MRSQAQPAPIYIEHINVVDVFRGGFTPDVTVEIRGSLIERIGSDLRAARDATIVDGAGKFLIPGLWDMHVHLREADPSFHALLASGITSVRVMYSGVPPVQYEAWRSDPDAVRMAVAGLVEGPLNEEDAKLAVQQLAAKRADLIEVSSDISREAYFAVADETRRLGWSFSGLVPYSVTLPEASKAAQLSIEGLNGIMRACLGTCDGEKTGQIAETLADNGTFLTPMLVEADYRGPLILDMQQAGVHLLAGSDAGDIVGPLGRSLQEELGRLVTSGLTPLEALQTATRNPALYFGTLTLMGTIEKGKAADLVILDANPLDDIGNIRKIRAVVMRGKYYSREMLDAFESKLPNGIAISQ